MAFKQRILDSWTKQRPNLAKLGHLYNLDDTVGLNCANKKSDVMLVQLLLMVWGDMRGRDFRPGVRGSGYSLVSAFSPEGANAGKMGHTIALGQLPINGVWGNRTLAWIFHFQLDFFHMDEAAITGKISPIRADGSSFADTRHTLLKLNAYAKGTFAQVYDNLASAPGVPQELAQALKQARS